MVEYNNVLMLIDTIAIFIQGYSFRRMNISIMLISSLITLLIAGDMMFLDGNIYDQVFWKIDIYDVIISIVYVLFFFISGYIIGGFQIVTAENMKVVKINKWVKVNKWYK